MKNIEERLWDYIDGTCTAEEHAAIEVLITQNDEWGKKHKELLTFNNEINAIEPDEPPMGFAFKVMEHIRSSEARTPLKTSVNKYLVNGIAALFFILLGATSVYIFWNNIPVFGNSATDGNIIRMDIFTGTVVLKVFAYLDIMLVLFFADRLFRKKFKGITT